MGSVADKIARKVATQIRSNVIDLCEFRAGRELAHEAGLDGSRFRELIEQGYDPAFAFYAQGLRLVSLFAEAISAMPEAKGYVKALVKAENEYMPEGPPISPLTASHFNMWAFFDLQFGSSRETIGTCILRVTETVGMPAWIAGIVRPMQDSRMGFYLHMGLDGPLVLLKDIVTQDILRCHSATGYVGERGQLWYTRLLPPPVLDIGHHVVITTPYVVLDGTEQRFLDYIGREVARMAASGGRKAADAETLLKHGPTINYWNEYIFQAYSNHRSDAIFLAGVPDLRESLPHAPHEEPPHRQGSNARAGAATHIVRAALRPKLYRDIEIPSDRSLHDLAAAIIRAYGFDLDHAFGFFPKLTGNIFTAKPRYELFADMAEGEAEDSLSVNKTTVAQAFPKVGKAMTFLFDYGDEWRFRVEVLARGEREPRKRYPKVIASVGKAPPQYPDPDEDLDDDIDDEE
ncbi:plasmid pRiA4b ORF-3 family protein [Azospirillum sp. SYSU D00513]|uniref:plasmid pRiA4b ORF-3 family protein n=1 Tax=Azospirillum sp. SYSU D00513 TaxID=2812561 RepID=UPI001FFF2BD2|nr:plasmid pRiA4b ORF-3 family protein [Azospirillum sp. SYSU D00513]